MNKLAIVIPAYKKAYFSNALGSLAAQTNKNFSLYIGDDCSPEGLKEISDSYANILDINYTRFDYNVGAKDLVGQWSRCIALTQGEEWLWLFSDDDITDATCVESFYKALAENQNAFDVYRFNTCVINAAGEVTAVMPLSPQVETSEQMAYHLLLGDRGNSMPDHIFSREVYERKGGFVSTAYAQGADWAMSMLFSQEKGIYVIPDAKVYWRLSGNNVSSVSPEKRAAMLKGHMQFIEWVLNHFKYLSTHQRDISYDMIAKAAMLNISRVVASHYKGVDNDTLQQVYRIARNKLGWSRYAAVDSVLLVGMHTEFLINKLYRLNKIFKKTLKISL